MLKRVIPCIVMLTAAPAYAHGPIFSPGPETVFKGGYELHTEYSREKAGSEREDEASVEVAYGITGDWQVGVEVPYAFLKDGTEHNDGFGNLGLSSKYRFWRNDMLGAQESVALLTDVILDTAHDHPHPAPSDGATDAEIGLAYGYETLQWQRWASARYRYNGKNDEGENRGDAVFLDATLGYRPTPPEYYKPDLMWLLEVNSEITRYSEQNGMRLSDTGGTEVFVSPGFFLTYRNAALKGGVQLPILSNLHGQQDASDYRFRLAIELHI